MIRRLTLVCLFFVLTLSTISVSGLNDLQPGARVIFTAKSTPVYAYPDENSDVVAVFMQGYVDRLGPPEANVGDWVFLVDQVGYVRADEAGLALRTDELQQQLIEQVTDEITQDPSNFDPYVRRGTIYVYMKNYESAITDYTQAINLAPDEPMAYALRGRTYRLLGQYDTSYADIQKAIDLGTEDVYTLISLGVAYERLGRDQDSFDQFQRVAAMHPESFFAANNQGVAKARVDENDAAMMFYNQATAINKFGNWPYFFRALLYQEQDNLGAAMTELENYISINPYDPDAYVRLSRLYTYDLRDPYTGLEYIEQALEIDPELAIGYMARGLIYAYELRDPEQAVDDFDRSIALDPYNADFYIELTAYYSRRGEYEIALDYFQQYSNVSPVHGKRFMVPAQIYYAMGDYDAARDEINYMLENETDYFQYGSDYTVGYIFLALIGLQEGDYVEAEFWLNFAFFTTTDWTLNWSRQRGARYIDNRAVLIQEYYENTLTDPDEPENYLQLGHLLMEFGAWNEALEYYRQYLTMERNYELQELVDMVQSYLDE